MLKMLGTTVLLAIIGITLILSPLQAKLGENQVYYQDQVAVLMYHHIHDKDQSSSTITTALFQKQLQMLQDKGYQFISLSEFKQFMEGSTVPDNAVLITFDDGYQSFYTGAYPILVKKRIPAVNFIITGTLANPLGSYIPYVSNEQITDMTHTANFIDAECHTDSLHYMLPSGKAALIGRMNINGQTESEDQYKQRILQDAASCREKLTKLGNTPIDSLAYPYGITNQQAGELVREAGFRYAFTISPEMATRNADPMYIPRINAGSPNITPELLHRTIQRRVVAQPKAVLRVDAVKAIEQLGGHAVNDADKLHISLDGDTFTIKANSRIASHGKDKVQLREPVTLEQQVIWIALNDLSDLLGKSLVYNKLNNLVTERIPLQISTEKGATPQ